jgi:hypothetical protein
VESSGEQEARGGEEQDAETLEELDRLPDDGNHYELVRG